MPGLVLALPLTKGDKKKGYQFRHLVSADDYAFVAPDRPPGQPMSIATALAEQVRVVSTKRLGSKLGTLTPEVMIEIEVCMRWALELL